MKIARRSWIIFLFLLVSCGSLKISKHTDLAGPSELGQADADNDSVPDLLDKCPRSIPGETIGRDGCPAPSVHPTLLEWNMLTFESGSSELTQESKSRLNDVIEFLNRTLTRIEIVGHSDACGDVPPLSVAGPFRVRYRCGSMPVASRRRSGSARPMPSSAAPRCIPGATFR